MVSTIPYSKHSIFSQVLYTAGNEGQREEKARAIQIQSDTEFRLTPPQKIYSHLDRKAKEFSIQNPIIYINSHIKVAQGPQPSAPK